jgi:hypothetical protein
VLGVCVCGAVIEPGVVFMLLRLEAATGLVVVVVVVVIVRLWPGWS